MLIIRHPMMCFSLYQTIGASVAAPVRMPLTIKNGIRQSKYAHMKSWYQCLFLDSIVSPALKKVAKKV